MKTNAMVSKKNNDITTIRYVERGITVPFPPLHNNVFTNTKIQISKTPEKAICWKDKHFLFIEFLPCKTTYNIYHNNIFSPIKIKK